LTFPNLAPAVLDGYIKDMTRDGIITAIRQINSTGDDAIFFYYAGHGAYDKNGQFFALATGEKLYRKDVLAALRKRGPDFYVLISDCCNTPAHFWPLPKMAPPVYRSPALFRKLFFSAKGWIDFTGAKKNQYGLYNTADGGLFTRALAFTMAEKAQQSIWWDEFFYLVRTRTAEMYSQEIRERVTMPDGIDRMLPGWHSYRDPNGKMAFRQLTQTPWSFSTIWSFRHRRQIDVNLAQDGFYTRFGADVDNKLRLQNLAQNSPAMNNGLEEGDVVTAINGNAITSPSDYEDAVDFSSRNLKLDIRDIRTGQVQTRFVQLPY
jgi:hypothetical protein